MNEWTLIKILMILSLTLTGCSTMYFSPVSWFKYYGHKDPETSATVYGDCTTDAQCEELVPGQNYFCYKTTSYVGQCINIVE